MYWYNLATSLLCEKQLPVVIFVTHNFKKKKPTESNHKYVSGKSDSGSMIAYDKMLSTVVNVSSLAPAS